MPRKAKVPGATPQELALQKAQAGILEQQRTMLQAQWEQQQVMMPFLAEQAGFRLKLDGKGKIIGMERINDPLEGKRKQIEGLELDRSLAALKGELPVDPSLERALGTQEATLRDRLRTQFGSGYETSTAGIQTLDEFMRSAEGLRSDARTGQLTLSEQLSMARQGSAMNQQGQNLNILGGATMGNAMSLFGAGNQLAAGYGQAQIPFLQRMQTGAQVNMQNTQNTATAMAGWGKLAGLMFGHVFPGGGA